MIRIGKYPILKHIIDNFCDQGFNEFVLCLGHKSKSIVDYFLIENKKNSKIILKKKIILKFALITLKKIFVDLVYTGKNSGTGGGLKLHKKLKLNEDVFMTYGDGLSDVNINKVINFHYKKKAIVTLTAVRPRQKYGILKIKFNKVNYFDNSNKKSDVFINGGFFVISKDAINFIKENKIYWEEFS